MDEEYPIAVNAKIEVIIRKLEFWKSGIYSAKLDVKVANITGNKQMLQEATQNLKNSIAIVDVLEEELKSLNE